MVLQAGLEAVTVIGILLDFYLIYNLIRHRMSQISAEMVYRLALFMPSGGIIVLSK